MAMIHDYYHDTSEIRTAFWNGIHIHIDWAVYCFKVGYTPGYFDLLH